MTGIERIDNSEGTKEGTTDLIINCASDEDLREKVFFAFAGASVPILEMRRVSDSLEDIYLTLTEEAGTEETAEEAEAETEEETKAETEEETGDKTEESEARI